MKYHVNMLQVCGVRAYFKSVDSTGPWPRPPKDRVIAIWLYYRCVERGRIKCGQYWPPEEDGEEQCDEFIVINTGMEQSQDYTITGLFLHNTKVATGS